MDEPIYTEQIGIMFSDETEGATDTFACRTRRSPGGTCRCQPKCIICGWGEHAALHGPVYRQLPGSKPWAHKFRPPVDDEPIPVNED